MALNKYFLGDLITQRREKNPGGNLPIRGVSKTGLQPPKQIDADTSIYNLYYRNDFVYNPARMELGSIAFNDEYDKAICSSLYEVFYVHRTDLVMPEYLALFVKNPEFARYCNYLGNGSAREYCRFDSISGIAICLPPLQEQQMVVKYYQIITNRIELLRKMSDNLEEMIATIFKHLILENEHYDNFTEFEFGRYPTAWKLKKLSDFVDVRDGTHDSPAAVVNGHKLVTSVHLNPYSVKKDAAYFISDDDYNEINKRSVVNTGDILMSMIGTVGRLSLVTDDPVDYTIKNIALFKTSKLSNGIALYLLSYLKSNVAEKYLSSFLSGSTQSYVSLETIRSMPVIVPIEDDLQLFIGTVEPMYRTLISFEKEICCLERIASIICP